MSTKPYEGPRFKKPDADLIETTEFIAATLGSAVPRTKGELMRWQKEAACLSTDPHIFYSNTAKEADAARRVCSSCDVQNQCLLYALENNEQHGIWGGKSPKQRRVILRNAKAKIQALQQKPTA